MTDILNIFEELKVANEVVKTKTLPLLAELKNTNLPLEDRWAVYTDLVNNNILVKDKTYGDGFVNTLNLSLYDDFYTERHETLKFVDMYDRIMEADGEYQEAMIAAREANLIAWQEEVLASGYSSFTYDW